MWSLQHNADQYSKNRIHLCQPCRDRPFQSLSVMLAMEFYSCYLLRQFIFTPSMRGLIIINGGHSLSSAFSKNCGYSSAIGHYASMPGALGSTPTITKKNQYNQIFSCIFWSVHILLSPYILLPVIVPSINWFQMLSQHLVFLENILLVIKYSLLLLLLFLNLIKAKII